MEDKPICVYGCGQTATHQLKNGKWCCGASRSSCPEIRKQLRQNASESWKKRDRTDIFKRKELPPKPESGLCEYGCGKEALHQLKNGKWCCSSNVNSCQEMRKKNKSGVHQCYVEGRMVSRFKKYDNLSPEEKERMKWNKGKTKETDDAVRRGGLTFAKHLLDGTVKHSMLGKHLSDETKTKMSRARESYLKIHPHVKWHYINNGIEVIPVQGGWEKKVAEWLNVTGVKWARKTLVYHHFRHYTPDFYLPELDVFLEVKGMWRDRDKYKMFLAIQDNPSIVIRVVDRRHIEKLDGLKIADLPVFANEFPLNDIDMNKFQNVWANDKVSA